MKLKILLMAGCLLLPIGSAFGETVDEYVAGLKKEASIGNTEAQKELEQFQELSKKANAGNAKAQYKLGMFYKEKADQYYERVYRANDVYEQQLQEWLGKAANKGNLDAARALVSFYKEKYKSFGGNYTSEGRQGKIDTDKKLEEWLIKLAQGGNAKDQYDLALYYDKSHDEKINEKAGIWIEKAASQGLEDAQIALGKGYLFGSNGISKNYNKAKAIFQKLADQDNEKGLYYLGLCYQSGYGVPKDDKKSVELYEAAAEKGSTGAVMYLTTVYLTGINNSVPQDRDKFRTYYNQICSTDTLQCSTLTLDVITACKKMHTESEDTMKDPDCRDVIMRTLNRGG